MPRAKGRGGKPKKNKTKLKTKSACKRRFKITKTGKTVIKKTNKRHHLESKSQKNIRHNRKAGVLSEGFAKMVKKCFLHVSRKKTNKK